VSAPRCIPVALMGLVLLGVGFPASTRPANRVAGVAGEGRVESELIADASLAGGRTWRTDPLTSRRGETDPALVTGLDGVVALSPPDTCLRVDIGHATVFRHQADRALIPASTQKVFVGDVALDRLGADHRFRTMVVGPGPVDGVVNGDLTLVGGGDPLLTTATYAFVRRTADQPLTFLDGLADSLVAAGVRRVTGRLVADESRYDTIRSVPSWPARYLSQNQVGPLGALTVDDGFRLDPIVPGSTAPPDRQKVDQPALHAADELLVLLRARGVTVDGGTALGVAPVGAGEVAAVQSAPLGEVVRQMLEESDNATAELLTKEIGVVAGTGGSTASGTASIRTRAAEMGVPVDQITFADGSGLDRGNRLTCDALTDVLERSGGPDGVIGSRLPVAGRSGTLENRFLGTPAQGRLKAKTGTLNGVTALAGFVTMTDGQTATFAYIANGDQAEDPRRGQDFLGVLLGQFETTCTDDTSEPMVIPLAGYAVRSVALGAVPVGALLVPAVASTLTALAAVPDTAVGGCTARAEGFSLDFGIGFQAGAGP